MRSDMAKVLVERPRPGSRGGNPPRKSYVSESRRALRRSLECGDSPPHREPHWQRIGWKRPFNEHLAPLCRYLRKQVGRPWDRVYSEICANINRNNVVQKHILTHLFEFVELHVVEVDGKILNADGRSLGYWNLYYVCPRTRLFRLRPRPTDWSKYYREFHSSSYHKPVVSVIHHLDPHHLCMKINDLWELVGVHPLPAPLYRPLSRRRDVILKKNVSNLTEEEVRKLYGRCVFAINRQVLTHRERKQLPIPW